MKNSSPRKRPENMQGNMKQEDAQQPFQAQPNPFDFILSSSSKRAELCLFIPFFPAFVDLLISFGQMATERNDISKSNNASKQGTQGHTTSKKVGYPN